MKTMTKLTPALHQNIDQRVVGTLKSVINSIDKIERISPGRRGDLRCAVRRLAIVIGQPLETIEVNLEQFQLRLDGLVPRAHGMTSKRWSTIKSDFQSALRLTGYAEPLQTTKATLLPVWSAVLNDAVYRHHRECLSRFARFCSMHNILPEEVDGGVLEKFSTALRTQSLVRKPGRIIRMTALAWNVICTSRIDFPGRPLPVLSNKSPPRRIALEELPPTFKDDLDRYGTWCAVADPLDDHARPRPQREITIAGNRDRTRSAITAAIEAGVPKETLTNLASLVAVETFTKILRQRHEMAGGCPSPQGQAIATLLITIAKEWVKVAPEHLQELKRLRSKLPALKSGLTTKNQQLLDKFESRELEARHLGLPDELWKEATSGKLPPAKALVRAQLALVITIEQYLGIRSLNLIQLSFARHLSWPAGPKGFVLVRIDAHEMKAGSEYNAELPPYIGKMLIHYRDYIVPAAIGRKSDAVFVNRTGTPKKQETLAVQFQNISLKRLGVKMSLHQNRHLGAQRILNDNPGSFETTKQWLGHANMKTTINFYGGVDTRRATRHHATLIERRREITRHLSRSKTARKGQHSEPRQR
jgi:integrase